MADYDIDYDIKRILRCVEHYWMVMGEPMSSDMKDVAKQIRKLRRRIKMNDQTIKPTQENPV